MSEFAMPDATKFQRCDGFDVLKTLVVGGQNDGLLRDRGQSLTLINKVQKLLAATPLNQAAICVCFVIWTRRRQISGNQMGAQTVRRTDRNQTSSGSRLR